MGSYATSFHLQYTRPIFCFSLVYIAQSNFMLGPLPFHRLYFLYTKRKIKSNTLESSGVLFVTPTQKSSPRIR